MKEVYIFLNPEGGVGVDMFTGKGKVYADKEKAEDALKRKNKWSETKGYGVYKLVALEVLT